jgi:hypothetical protein
MRVSRIVLSLALALTGSAVAIVPSWAETTRVIGYHGYRVAIPEDWQVVDLSTDPHACVRFDRPTVYLGHPGEEPWCPTDLVGRTAGLIIEPLDAVTADHLTANTAVAPRGKADAGKLVSHDDSIRVAVPDAGVLVTAAHTPDTESAVRQVLASASLGREARPVSLPTVR